MVMGSLKRLMDIFNSSTNVEDMTESLKQLKEKIPEQLSTLEWTMVSYQLLTQTKVLLSKEYQQNDQDQRFFLLGLALA